MAKKKRKRKVENKNLKRLKLAAKYLAAIALSGLTGFVIFIVLIYAGVFGKIPNEENLNNIKNNLATEIYSADGEVLGRFFIQQRTPTAYEDISKSVIDALVATEDARFYEHKGIDSRSLLRVIVKTFLLQDRSAGGGSTISQQLAKNLFPRDNGLLGTAVSKIKESIIAFRLESIYTKEEILTLYLNTVPFGENIYGIEIAANRFFSKSASDLKTEEAAVLVGMLKANHSYNPRLFPENSLARRNTVLRQMNKYEYLEDDSLTYYQNKPLEINYNKISTSTGSATYFREQLRQVIQKWCDNNPKPDGSAYNLYTDGLKIYTTLDSRMQQYAEEAMKAHMAELQKSFDQHWKNSNPWEHNEDIVKNATRQSPHYKQLKASGMSDEEIKAEFNKSYPMKVFSWEGDKELKMTPQDSIEYYIKFLQAGVLAMSPENGEIKAWVGGINHEYFKYDHVKTSTKRQVGSTFKPFVYAAALEKGIDPCKHISARKTTYTNLEGWSPENADEKENDLKYSFQGALTHSVNTVTVKVLEDVQVQNAISLANNAGISTELPAVPSVALGTADISLLEMVTAYSVFANEGRPVDPFFITRVETRNGEVLYEKETEEPKAPVMLKENSQLITAMLQSVVNKGTASRARWKYKLTNDLAGKTGTTQSNADGWFIGYNPKLVVGVWVGADSPGIRFRTTNLGSGSNMALPIFSRMFQLMNKDDELNNITKARFPALPAHLQSRLDCDPFKEDKNFFERLLNTDLTKGEKERKFDDKEDKKGFFKKIGDLFKKKDKGN